MNAEDKGPGQGSYTPLRLFDAPLWTALCQPKLHTQFNALYWGLVRGYMHARGPTPVFQALRQGRAAPLGALGELARIYPNVCLFFILSARSYCTVRWSLDIAIDAVVIIILRVVCDTPDRD